MAYVESWVETDPDGSVITVSQLDDYQRQAKRAVRERLEGDAAAPLTGLMDSFSAGTIKMGSGRIHAVLEANIGTLALQDGRMVVTTDSKKLYHLKGSGAVEIAYASTASPTFTGTATFVTITATGSINAGAALNLGWTGRSQMASPSDGVILLTDNAAATFSRLQFGGTAATFPAIKRSGATLAFRLADDSADASISFKDATTSGDVIFAANQGLTNGTTRYLKAGAGATPTVTITGVVDVNSSAGFALGTVSGRRRLESTGPENFQLVGDSDGLAGIDLLDALVHNSVSFATIANGLIVGGTAQTIFLSNDGAHNNLVISDAGVVTTRAGLNSTGDFKVATDKFTVDSSNGNTVIAGTLTLGAAFLSSSPSGGFGYTTGAGDVVVQGGAVKTQGVTLNAITGQITTNTGQAAGTGTPISFTVSNSSVRSADTVVVTHVSGGTLGAYNILANAIVNNTSFNVTIRNISGGNLSEALVIQFSIIRGATS